MLTENSFLTTSYKTGYWYIGRIKKPDPNIELYYVEWESNSVSFKGELTTEIERLPGYGYPLAHIEATFLGSKSEGNIIHKICQTEKELLEFRIKCE